MSIRIIEDELFNPEDNGTRMRIEINGVIDEHSFFYEGSNISAKIKSIDTLNYLRKQSLDSLTYLFDDISFEYKPEWSFWDYEFDLSLKKYNNEEYDKGFPISEKVQERCFFNVYFNIDYKYWNFPYSIADLENEVEKYINSNRIEINYTKEVGFEEVMRFSIEVSDRKTNTLIVVENEILHLIKDIHLNVLKIMQDQSYPDLLTTFFEFPEDIKTSCKQYLIYFAQFLADMGINATTSIKEDANKVLFTVIPEDENIALSKIQEALTLYLNAPTFVNIGDNNLNKDIAVLQWESNIYHLKSQLALSQAILQTKDTTIEALALSNYQLKQMVSSDNYKKKLGHSSNEEELIKGVVSVKKYDGKAFSIDLPEIIRKLKRKFKK